MSVLITSDARIAFIQNPPLIRKCVSLMNDTITLACPAQMNRSQQNLILKKDPTRAAPVPKQSRSGTTLCFQFTFKWSRWI